VLGCGQHDLPGAAAASALVTMAHDFARVLVVLAEALVSEKRVLVVGDASLGMHELLSELGARIVHVFDPDGARALAQPPPHARGTVLRGLPDGDFEVRDGAFDLALVPDVSAVPDAAALLARLRRVVGNEGAVMCAARNADALTDGADAERALGYYDLYDLVSLQFAHVRMIAAMPFVGMTLAELGQDEVDAAVRVDTQLAGDRPPPTAFVALASQEDVALDAYSVIELASRPAEAKAPPELGAALAQAHLRAEYLEAQVEELQAMRAARTRAEEEARRALEALEHERDRALRLERDVDALSSAKIKAEAPRAETEELADQLAQAQLRAAALEEGIELAEKTIIVQRDRITEVEAELADLHSAPARSAGADDAAEIAALEAKLKERGEVVASLEAELARREKLVRELVARLESEASEPMPDPLLTKKLDDLALLAARQKSDLEARAWRIGELERALSKHEAERESTAQTDAETHAEAHDRAHT
jgi:hypothetical protein